ncbi:MAG: SDR family oxidoreductase [Verrucomicrobiaceae bacterium]|nr:MAG: SDR family oxidoreductase [Verrucomicrobiaceae bacterium]
MISVRLPIRQRDPGIEIDPRWCGGDAPAVRSILVTGGNGGLGLGIGRYFLEQDPGASVWLGVRSNRDLAGKLAAEFPGRCRTVDLEVTDSQAWKFAVETILETDGRLDVLVNNAGMHRDCLLAAMPDEDWRSVIAANLDAVFHGCRAVITPMMRQRHGRIVNIASLSAVLPPLGQTNYAAAKAGVVALGQTLAKETARSGITVNSILPGFIETDALGDMDEEAKKNARRGIPMRRFGKPEEVAAAVYFLASAEAAYITGASLKIDGGIF